MNINENKLYFNDLNEYIKRNSSTTCQSYFLKFPHSHKKRHEKGYTLLIMCIYISIHDLTGILLSEIELNVYCFQRVSCSMIPEFHPSLTLTVSAADPLKFNEVSMSAQQTLTLSLTAVGESTHTFFKGQQLGKGPEIKKIEIFAIPGKNALTLYLQKSTVFVYLIQAS